MKIATLNLNGETWWSINRRPRLPQSLFDITKLRKTMTCKTAQGLNGILSKKEYDIIALQELIYSQEERETIKNAIEEIRNDDDQPSYKLVLPNKLGANVHFTVGFIVRSNLNPQLDCRWENSEHDCLSKNRRADLKFEIEKKNYYIINIHVNNHNVEVPKATERTILVGDMNACAENQASDKKAKNDVFLKKLQIAGWAEIGDDEFYTWESNGVNRKLDHLFLCETNNEAVKEARVRVDKSVNFYEDEENGFTDHSMLAATLNEF